MSAQPVTCALCRDRYHTARFCPLTSVGRTRASARGKLTPSTPERVMREAVRAYLREAGR